MFYELISVWNYKIPFYENLLLQKNQTFMKILYYENFEPYGMYNIK